MNTPQPSGPFSVAVDIGTSKVAVLIGRKDEYGKIEILGYGKANSQGVIRGQVSNIEKTVQAIREAMQKAHRKTPFRARKVNIGISGFHIKSIYHRGIFHRDNVGDEIAESDVEFLVRDMHKLQLPAGEKLLDIFPQEFTVDGDQGIVDPRGMFGVRLEANFHMVSGQVIPIKNLERCVHKAGLEIGEIALNAVASANAVLSKEEMEAGVLLLDIGAGTTDLAIYTDGILRHVAVIPFGGNTITKDIQEVTTVMSFDRAEYLKVTCGKALASEAAANRMLVVTGLPGHGPTEISDPNLASIIQARIEEILDFVMEEIKKVKCENRLYAGVVVTGGTSLTKHIADLIAYHTRLPTRVGSPLSRLANGYHEELASPVYSTALGILIQGIEKPFFPEEETQIEKVAPEAVAEMGEIGESERGTGGKPVWINILLEGVKDLFKEDSKPLE